MLGWLRCDLNGTLRAGCSGAKKIKPLFPCSTTDVPAVFSISYGDEENGVSQSYALRANVEFQKAGKFVLRGGGGDE